MCVASELGEGTEGSLEQVERRAFVIGDTALGDLFSRLGLLEGRMGFQGPLPCSS